MIKQFTYTEILELERFFRMNLINTISGLKAANLIGTISPEGVPNLGVFNSVVHIGANPPYLGFIMRPLTVPRHTYSNLKATQHFTINHIHPDILAKAHQTSAKYEADTSEFEATGLTPQYSELHPAPYVAESAVQIGLEYTEEHPIQANGTVLIVGRIVELRVSAAALGETGHVELDAIKSLGVAGLDTYYTAQQLERLGYARVVK
ncbi:MAG: flavin reductase [Bacteroidota bacterium]